MGTAGPKADANPARGAWLLGGERDRPRNKKNVTTRVQEREPMFSGRRKPLNEQSQEREEERRNKHQTE